MSPSQQELNGLEQLRFGFEQKPAGIIALTGMIVEEMEHGSVRFRIEPNETMTNPLGTVHGGIAATLLDSVASCAVHSALPAGSTYATTQLNVHFTRAIQPDGTPITGVGTVIHMGRSTATATGTLTDPEGRIVAHGSVTCAIRS